MIMREITTAKLADAMRMPVIPVQQMLTRAEFQSIRPEQQFAGRTCMFNERQAFLMMIAGDLVRFGIKSPLAGRVADRIAESLSFDPNAPTLHIEFRANGASFAFTTDEPPEAATVAGPRRFRLTFDLRAYRAAVDAAMIADDAE